MAETIYDGMQGWTNKDSEICLNIMMLNALTGIGCHPKNEKVINQLLTFMVRDLERKGLKD